MRIGIITDVHLAPVDSPPARWHNEYDFPGAEERLQRAIQIHQTRDVALAAMLGDLTNFGDATLLQRGLDLLGTSGVDVLAVPGNHDCDDAIDRLAQLLSSSKPRIRAATTAGEAVQDFLVVGLPIVDRQPEHGWLVDRPDVVAFRSAPAIVLSHFPLLSREDAARQAGLRYAGGSADRDGLAATLLAREGPTIVIHGHLHIRDAVAIGPILQIGCAALIEPPHEIAFVDLTASAASLTVRVERHAVAPSPSEARLPLLTGETGAWKYERGAWIADT